MSHPLATIIIPVSAEHAEAGVHRDAIETAQQQTVLSTVDVLIDRQGAGAGAMRNRGAERATTPFLIFLDADDLIDETFVERTLQRYQRGVYVYTDWYFEDFDSTHAHQTPDCLNSGRSGMQHIVTTLLPRAAWEAVGGFDETLTTLEDEDFYRKLHARGWFGVRCPEELVIYRRRLGHSLININRTPDDLFQERVQLHADLFRQKYERFSDMGCGCGGNAVLPPPEGSNDDMVLVETLYSPTTQVGPVTNAKYERRGMGYPLWVHRADAEARPDLWQIIGENPKAVSPDRSTVLRLAKRAPSPTETQEVGIVMNRDEIMAELTARGIPFSKYTNTEKLRDLLARQEKYAS